jgi:hypothetical protein
MAMTRQSALDIMVCAALSQTDQYRILALPDPIEPASSQQLSQEEGAIPWRTP